MTADIAFADPDPNLFGRPDTALRHTSRLVPTAARDDLVSETLDRMRGKRFESAAAIAVLDEEHL
jgi:magnesium transporter